MKKVLFLGLAVGALAFTSCTREFECECSGSGLTISGGPYEEGDADFENAKDNCKSTPQCEWKKI